MIDPLKKVFFIDIEVSPKQNRIADIGALSENGGILHTSSVEELINFLKPASFLCGHNIIHHDITYLSPSFEKAGYVVL